MSGTSDGIHAIATRIQDRASQLTSERRVLDLVKAEQNQQQAILDEEMESCGMVRRDYLTAIRSRHGVELELWKIEEQKKECVESMEELQHETQDLRRYKGELQSTWEELATDVLADHHLKREIYRCSIQTQMDQREDQMLKRNRQLMDLTQKVENLRKCNRLAEEQKALILSEMEELRLAEREGDEEVSNLAEKVREMVAKRSGLRKSIRTAKKIYDEINEETLKWEKECCELANDASNTNY